MKIRTAKMDDLEKIVQIEATCFPKAEAATEESFKNRLDAFSEYFWVLEKEGEIIGFVNGMVTNCADLTDEMYENAKMHTEEGKWQMIFGLDVLPEYQCRGYAAMLMNHLISEAEKQGRRGIVLTCKDRLIHYYAKFGFENEGISGSTHGDVIWYQMRKTFSGKSE
ncbi:MAG: GNAT family N-acetyltransferase [Schaedlerella sp.]|nr:GNAT family N-acetyltransferase [Schaedlerella sp.]